MSKKPKDNYDWESIEKDVRAGILSLREIARKHSCPESSIRFRMKEGKWQRDLSGKIKQRAQQKLLRAELRKSNVKEEDVIEENAETVAAVLLLERKDIKNLRELETQLINEIKNNPTKLYITQYQGQIIEKVVGLTAAERAMAANNLANVQHKRIALERQAFGIDDTEKPNENPIIDLLNQISQNKKPLIPEYDEK